MSIVRKHDATIQTVSLDGLKINGNTNANNAIFTKRNELNEEDLIDFSEEKEVVLNAYFKPTNQAMVSELDEAKNRIKELTSSEV